MKSAPKSSFYPSSFRSTLLSPSLSLDCFQNATSARFRRVFLRQHRCQPRMLARARGPATSSVPYFSRGGRSQSGNEVIIVTENRQFLNGWAISSFRGRLVFHGRVSYEGGDVALFNNTWQVVVLWSLILKHRGSEGGCSCKFAFLRVTSS